MPLWRQAMHIIRNFMIVNKITFLILFVFLCEPSFGQPLITEKPDTTISIFWNTNLKVRVQILNPEVTDPEKKNALVTIFPLDKGANHILFKDSIFANILLIKQADIDGDGIQDLLIFNQNNGPQNKSYNLYLVNQKSGVLTRVKGFEKVFNPTLDQRSCFVIGFESFDSKLIVKRIVVHKNGNWGFVGW